MSKRKPVVFIQDTGILPSEMLVMAGATKKDAQEFFKKVKIKKDAKDWFYREMDDKLRVLDSADGAFVYDEEGGYSMLLLKTPEDSFNYMMIVAHELIHALHFFRNQKRFDDEWEFEAYLFEYLFKNVYKKLR